MRLLVCFLLASSQEVELDFAALSSEEASVHFDAKSLAACELEQADAYWETHPFRKTPFQIHRQLTAMQALKELKTLFSELSLPMILVGDLLLGFRRGCLASVSHTSVKVATFGPWLQEVGLGALTRALRRAGHRLDVSDCPEPLEAGCQLQATLRGGAEAKIQVLFSAPPRTVGGRPGAFPHCSESCGANCARCSLALPAKATSGRFFACPLPLKGFRLASWMNETYWLPLDVDAYLEVDYGNRWPETELAAQSCAASRSSGLSFAAYESYIPSLPRRSDVIRLQRVMEKQRAEDIHAMALGESYFWKKFFGARSFTWPSRPVPEPLKPARAPSDAPLLMMGAAGVAVGAWLLTAGREGLVFGFQLFLSSSSIFLQKDMAGRERTAVSNALVASAAHAVLAAGLLGCRPRLYVLKSPLQTHFGSCPLWLWMLLPGALQAMSFYLSFLSLATLEPLSYMLLYSSQAYLPATSSPLRSACLACACGAALSAPQEAAAAALGAALTAQMARQARQGMPEPAQAVEYGIGFLVLSILAVLQRGHVWPGGLDATALFACLTLCGLNLSRAFAAVPRSLAALQPGLEIAAVAMVQGFQEVPLPTRSWHGVLQVILSLAAAAAHALDLFNKSPKSQAPAKTVKLVRRPAPPQKLLVKRSPSLSEVGSTAATEADLELPDGI